ncbi:MAG: thioredoxin family protein [Pirellulales bacterium]|nr:thioredoxin family protein [Pirellulales bacterium]
MLPLRVAIFLLATSLPFVAIAEPIPDQERAKLAEHLFQQMRAHRAQLRRGIWRCTGSAVTGSGESRLETPVELFCAFDVEQNLLRFDRTQSRRTITTWPKSGESLMPDDPAAPGTFKNPIITTNRYAYYRAADHSADYMDGGLQVWINRPAAAPHSSLEAFDIRAAGLLVSNHSAEWTLFETVLDGLLRFAPDEIVDQGEGLYRVRWFLFDGNHRRTMWVDVSHGFSVTRFELQDRRSPGGPREQDGWPAPYRVTQARWSEVDGVWVPTQLTMSGHPSTELKHQFQWQSVNRPVPTELFSIEGLNCQKGTSVYCRLGSHVVVERHIGIEPIAWTEKAPKFFQSRGEFADRLANARKQCQQRNLRTLIVLGDPADELALKFLQLREQDRTLAPSFGHYLLMPISPRDMRPLSALVAAYRPVSPYVSLPTVAVLDERNRLVAMKSAVIGKENLAADAEQLLKFLENHAAQYPDAEQLLAAALLRAEQEDKKVFLHFSGPFCAACRRLEQFIEEHKTVFDENYVDLRIDGRFRHADEVIDRYYKGIAMSVPWIAILDAQAKSLATSDGPEGNIGFPSKAREIEHFLNMLATTAPRITEDQLAELRRQLERQEESSTE